jgi:hypothetical protein
MESFIEWLQILIPSVLVVVSGLIGYVIKSRADEYLAIKEKINQEQREIYKRMLNPYIDILAGVTEGSEPAKQPQISPKELRKTLFELNLIGSDDVIRAYNKILQNAYKNAREGVQQNPKEMVLLFGGLLLEVRKSLGHKNTKLKPKDMFEGMIKDIYKYF